MKNKIREIKIKNKLLIVFLVSLFGIIISACEDDENAVPDVTIITPTDIEANAELDFILDLYEGQVVDFNQIQNGGELITSGYIISSDETNNINHAIYIQDKPENPTSGVVINVAVDNIHVTHSIGRKVIIKLKDLGMTMINGALHIGSLEDGKIVPIREENFNTTVIRTSEKESVIPRILTTSDILSAVNSTETDDDFSAILVQLENMQLVTEALGESYANPNNNDTIDRLLISCDDQSYITLRNSGESIFKAQQIPQNNGSITAILVRDALIIRSLDDVDFNAQRCADLPENQANVSLSEVRDIYEEEIVVFKDVSFNGLEDGEEPIVSGYVISSDEEENINNKLYIQDEPENPTAGIVIDFDAGNLFENYPIGQKININLSGLAMNKIDGILRIGKLNSDENAVNAITPSVYTFTEVVVPSDDPLATIVPTLTTIEDLESGNIPEQTLVTINNMQVVLAQRGTTYGEQEEKMLINCDTYATIPLINDMNSNFKDEIFPENQGTITAVYNSGAQQESLVISHIGDIAFTEVPCEEEDALFIEDFQGIPAENVGQEIVLNNWYNEIVGSNTSTHKWISMINADDNIFARITANDSEEEFESWLISKKVYVKSSRNISLSVVIRMVNHDVDALNVFIINDITEENGLLIDYNDDEPLDVVPLGNTNWVTNNISLQIPEGQNSFRIGFRYKKGSSDPITSEYRVDTITVTEETTDE